MKIYDISQEIFTSQVYPGDPQPQKYAVSSISDGEVCNVTAFSMCAHNGTHIDAPLHFFENGTAIDKIPLEKTVGFCYVACHEGKVSASDATEILLSDGSSTLAVTTSVALIAIFGVSLTASSEINGLIPSSVLTLSTQSKRLINASCVIFIIVART